MSDLLVSLLLKCYPSGWRSDYGAEMEDLLKNQPLTLQSVCDVLRGALQERMRQPQVGLFACLGLVSVALFLIAVVCSPLLWQLTAAPAQEVLRQQNIKPPMLVATMPREQALIVWLGIPLLPTLFVLYPVAILLASRKVISSQARKIAAARSATFYTAGFAAGFVAWQYGSFGWLIQLLPDHRNVGLVSVSECYGLLVASTFGIAIVSQLPLLLHQWQFRPESAK